MNNEERLASLKRKLQEVTVQQAKWSHELETAQSSIVALTAQLSEKFGVETVSQAQDLLADMSAELSKLMTEAETQLEKLRNDS